MKTLSFSILILLSITCTAQLPPVESYNIFYNLEVDSITQGIERINYEYFNVENDTISYRRFVARQRHHYQNGHISSIDIIDEKSDSVRMTYFLDTLGRMTSQERFGKNQRYLFITYEYNEDDAQIIERTFDQDSVVLKRTISQYDSLNQLILMEFYGRSNLLETYMEAEYDQCGNIIQQTKIVTPDGPGITAFGGPKQQWPNDTIKYINNYYAGCKLESKVLFRNSSKDALTEYFDSGDTLIQKKSSYSYGGDINNIKTIKKLGVNRWEFSEYLGSSPMTFENRFESDILVQSLIIYSNAPTKHYEYETRYTYDDYGNWTKREHYENGVLTRFVLRSIEYTTKR